MDKLFDIHHTMQNKIDGVADSTKEFDVRDLIIEGCVSGLKDDHYILDKGEFTDYQGSCPVYRMCSEKMKTILDENKGPEDEIQWLKVYVENKQGEKRGYYILHFPKFYDTVDWDRCILQKDKTDVIKPVFSKKKIEGKHKIFNYPRSRLALVITEDIKKKLQKAKCTGIFFSKVPLVD